MTLDPACVVVPVDQHRADSCIGASEAAAALGQDPWTPPLIISRKLRGLPIDDAKPAHVQEAAEWGQILEPVIRGRYALQRECVLGVPVRSLMREDWLRATPDGVVLHPDVVPNGCAKGSTIAFGDSADIREYNLRLMGTGLVQVKTCSPWAWRAWHEAPPVHHEIQARVEMAVCDLPWDDLAYLVGGQHMTVRRVERDAQLEDRILCDLKAFYDRAMAGQDPDLDASQAWRKLVDSRLKKSTITATLPEEHRGAIYAWRSARRDQATAKSRIDLAMNEIKLLLSAVGATKLDCGDDGFVYAYEIKSRVDWKKYALSLGGTEDGGEKFRPDKVTWGLRAPREWSNDDGQPDYEREGGPS